MQSSLDLHLHPNRINHVWVTTTNIYHYLLFFEIENKKIKSPINQNP